MTIQNELIKSLETYGNEIAIEHAEKKISYATLSERINSVTRFLLKNNVPKETIIGIKLRDKSDLITAMIGVMNARCTFVLLDSSLPGNRLKAMLLNMNLKTMIISSESAQESLDDINDMNVYTFEDVLGENDKSPIDFPEYNLNDSIYIYFTSGSTGTPKGIVGKNSALLNFIQWEIKAFNLGRGLKVSQLISPYFDAFLRDIFVPLLSGGTICIPPQEEDFFFAEKLISWIDESRIELIHCVPSLFRLFNTRSLGPEHFQSLQYVLLSAEKIIPAELSNWYKTFGSRIQLVNLYGTTETTMVSSFYKINPDDVSKSRLPIGFPISNTTLLITNDKFKSCEPLIPGDLFIISDFTTKGYLNNPTLTNERFFKIRTEDGSESIAYYTGDKARLLPTGELELMGREDRQVKIRGIRIELDEIERILIECEFIKNSIAVKHVEENGDEALIAFFIKEEGIDSNRQLEQLAHQHMEKNLPKYMIPSNIIEVTQFPLLSNGKVDYKKLLHSLTVDNIVPPTDVIEIKLVAIWKEIVGDKPISTEVSFHKLGGNSLSIMKLIGRIYKDFNVRISLGELFENLTIKKQVEFIKRSVKNNLYVIPKVAPQGSYNVSSAQERIYYNFELNKAQTAYNMPMAWEILSVFDKEKIASVFHLLIDRHEALRTEFVIERSKLCQKVKESIYFEIEEIQDVAPNNVEEVIKGLIKPFDLGKAPLFRCALIYTTENKKILVVDIHHIICDGVSQQILFSDFLTLYNGGTLKDLTLQYKDYAEWESQFKTKEEYISLRQFWLSTFEDKIPKLDLPTTNINLDSVSDSGVSVTFQIEHKKISALLDFLKREEITNFSGLFALYYMFLAQLTGQEDIVIGTAASGRTHPELERVLGMFVKMLPIRFTVDSEKLFTDFVKGFSSYFVQANGRQIYDLANIVSELSSNRVSPVESLFDAVFVFFNYNENKAISDNDQFSVYTIEKTSSKYPITLLTGEHESWFDFRLQCSSAYFVKSDLELLAAQFQLLAETSSQHLQSEIIEIIGDSEMSNDIMETDISFNI